MGRKFVQEKGEEREAEVPRSARKGGLESGKKATRTESPSGRPGSVGRHGGGGSDAATPMKTLSKSEGKKRGESAERERPATTPGGKSKGGGGGATPGGSEGEGKKRKRKSSAGAESSEEEQKEATKVHMARFLSIQPSGISAMAHDPIGQRLAVARSNGDIHIWNTSLPRWHPVAVCSGSTLSQVRTLLALCRALLARHGLTAGPHL